MTREQTLFIDEFEIALNASRLIRIVDQNGLKILRTIDSIYILINNKDVVDYIINNVKSKIDFGLTKTLNIKNRLNKKYTYFVRFPINFGYLKIFIKEEEIQEWQE